MTRIFASIAAASLLALTACSSGGETNKFLGEWQSIDSPARPHMLIQKRGDNLTVLEGKKEYPVSFDKENRKLSINTGMGALDIIYLEEKDHILASGAGEYSRVAK